MYVDNDARANCVYSRYSEFHVL